MSSYTGLGVMSGSSLDGLDLCCVEFTGDVDSDIWSYCVKHARTVTYTSEWRERLAGAQNLSGLELIRLHYEYARFMGRAIQEFFREFETKIDFVATHGHTVFHQPDQHLTFQLGDGETLSTYLTCPLVTNFRKRRVMAVIGIFLVLVGISTSPVLINAACVTGARTCSVWGGTSSLSSFDGEEVPVKTDCTVKLADFTCRGYSINAIAEMMYVKKQFTVSNFFITITDSTGFSWPVFMDATYVEDFILNNIDPHEELWAPSFVTMFLDKTSSGDVSFVLTLEGSDFHLNFTKTSNDASPGGIVFSCGDVKNAKAYPDNLCGGTGIQGIHQRTASSNFTSIESAIFYDSLYREIIDPDFIQLSTRCAGAETVLETCADSKRRQAHDTCGQLWVNDATRNSFPMTMGHYYSCLRVMCKRDVTACKMLKRDLSAPSVQATITNDLKGALSIC